MVNGEMVLVAKGLVILLKQNMMHTMQLPSDVVRVSMIRVTPSYEEVDHPMQPEGAESQMKITDCRNWTLMWPMMQIALGGTTPHRTRLPSAIHGNVPPPGPYPLGPSNLKGPQDLVADHDEAADEQEGQEDVDQYFNNDYVIPLPEIECVVPC